MEEYYPEIREMTVEGIRADYGIDREGRFITCAGSVPQAIVCFLEAHDFESAVRAAVSLGGDADTQAAITGSMAEAFYGVPAALKEECRQRLPVSLRAVLDRFDGAISTVSA